ncbi:MAG: PolC-type DNA polymerase III [Candidatus Muiribacteriota bacterium]
MSEFKIELEDDHLRELAGSFYPLIKKHSIYVSEPECNVNIYFYSDKNNLDKIDKEQICNNFCKFFPESKDKVKISVKPHKDEKSNKIKDSSSMKNNILNKISNINGRTKFFKKFVKEVNVLEDEVRISIYKNYYNIIRGFSEEISRVVNLEMKKINSSLNYKVKFNYCELDIPQVDNSKPEILIQKKKPVKKEVKKDKVYAGRWRKNRNYIRCNINRAQIDDCVEISAKVIDYEDIIPIRNNKFIHSCVVVDSTQSIYVKAFLKEEKKLFKTGDFLKFKGRISYDKFLQENILILDTFEEDVPVFRKDTCENKRVELHLHTKMSMDDATSGINEVVEMAARWGHKALAITDHGVVQGFPSFYASCKKNNIKPLLGMEGYLFAAEKEKYNDKKYKNKTHHIIIIAANETGRKNLYKLVSYSHLYYFYYKPLIPLELLQKYREGLVLGSACERGEVFQALLNKKKDKEVAEIVRRYDFLEIQPLTNNFFMIKKGIVNTKEDLKKLNQEIVKLGQKYNKPVVATCDSHFIEPADAEYRKVLQAFKGFDDFMNQPGLYLRTTDEMLEEFSYLGEDKAYEVVVENSLKVADMIEEFKPIPDGFYPPTIEDAEEKLINMVYSNAEKIYGNPIPEVVKNRLEIELDSIVKYKFSTLFYLAHLLVKQSLQDGYLVGSRGSVGSSAVARFSNITEVNPLPPHYVCSNCKYSEFFTDIDIVGVDLDSRNCPECNHELKKDGFNIPFQVFMGFSGDKVPDIDLNFSGEYQSIIHKWVEEYFGSSHTYKAGTISGLKAGQGKMYLKKYVEKISGDEENASDLKKSEEKRIIKGIEGVKKTTGQHPGGVIVVPRDKEIYDFSPVNFPANKKNSGVTTTHFDYHVMDSQLVKLDMLGHDDPTIIKHLQKLTGVNINDIPLDDKETMKLFTEVNSNAIPEFGTNFVKRMLEDTNPTKFTELIRISGLSHGTDVWTNNAQDLIRENKADLENVISVRDDIMNFLINKGLPKKMSFDIMEFVRKGKGLKPEWEEAMKKNKVPQWYIDSCKKIKYMFPKAHAVAYVVMAYRIAWFKVNYPREFYATYFSIRTFNGITSKELVQGKKYAQDRINMLKTLKDPSQTDKNLLSYLEVAVEAMDKGIEFYEVDIYNSDYEKYLLQGENGLRCPLISLEGLGEKAAAKICSEREKRVFKTQAELTSRCGLNKNVLALLREKKCLEDMPECENLQLF